MTNSYTLDAWAILALIQGEEPAASRIKELFDAASIGAVDLSISLINLSEVVYRIGKSIGEKAAWETLNEIQRLPMSTIQINEEITWSAVRFKIEHPISYADAFAAATAKNMDAVLLTGDPELFMLSDLISIEKLERER
ncbi:MAG: PIN domain-containing protein [Anaerolineales bacterium]|nr:PIN domain-containing protein [Anaerolineales bacterium]